MIPFKDLEPPHPSVHLRPSGLQSGRISGKKRPRADGCCGWLHGLQHRHPAHRDPERSHAQLHRQFSEETTAGQIPVLWCDASPGQASQGWGLAKSHIFYMLYIITSVSGAIRCGKFTSMLKCFPQFHSQPVLHLKTPWPAPVDLLAGWFET